MASKNVSHHFKIKKVFSSFQIEKKTLVEVVIC